MKKLMAKSNKKTCKQLGVWAKSICNHLYWTAATCHGDVELVHAKWQSILRHVCNIHDSHPNQKYPECEHGELHERDWLTWGSKSHKELELIINSPYLIKDIGNLSPGEQ
ncbi:Uncharacterised protein r2_g4345, partial [Pycnogonum litorale]